MEKSSVSTDSLVHVLLVSFPGQGHVNPLLRLGKRLASKGLLVTLTTIKAFGKDMIKANNITDEEPIPVGDGYIRVEFFDDGLDENDPIRGSLEQYMPLLESKGKKEITRMIHENAEQNRPVSCLINNPFIPWVSDVGESLGLPSAVLWVQSCASFTAYYYYFHNLVRFPTETDPFIDVQIPSLPLLKFDEIPSFLHPSTPYSGLTVEILKQFGNLEKSFCVLMETFAELETENIEFMSKLCPIKPVGPLLQDSKEDLSKADDCIEWLDSKPESSVVYISFGTVVYLKQKQVEEIAYALLNSGLNFLWVIRPPPPVLGLDPNVIPDDVLTKTGERGKIVEWSPQEKVLRHKSVACFVSHCGWNSTMEALTSGVPVVGFPQWGDQVTNAVYIAEVFKTGVRLCRGEAEDRIIGREEVEKCLTEATVGEKAVEMKRNALKWKRCAEEAVGVGGSSDRNLQDFVDEVKKRASAVNI